jgi:hypothetical protein
LVVGRDTEHGLVDHEIDGLCCCQVVRIGRG